MTYDTRRQGGGGPPPERTLEQIWPGYLKDGYFDQQGNLIRDFVTRNKVGELVGAMKQAKPALTSSQVRRYFGHCRAIESHINSGATWEQERAGFLKLDVSAADAIGKQKIPRLFHEFIRANVAAVQTKQDFVKGFLSHFEALVGFGSPFK